MSVKLISVTPDSERIIMYCARVSSPQNQDSNDPKLIRYCIKHGHHSILEMAHMTVEVTTSRAISAQILRHKSLSFQEFSQRYQEVPGYVQYTARRQDDKNRQNSIDDLSKEDQDWFTESLQNNNNRAIYLYKQALSRGIAKECARMFLPMNTETKLYISGNLRSWTHYLDVRCDASTQLEHREIANAIKEVFIEQFPIIAAAKGWTDEA